jgi:hypothetical protein
VSPQFEDLQDNEREWLSSCIGSAEELVAAYSPADIERPLDAAVLDRVWATYLATGDTDMNRVNEFLTVISLTFGQLLVEAVGFAWVVASDEYGTEIALLALPGKGDALVYPINMITKRWESQETDFMVPLFGIIAQQIRDVQAQWKA